MKEFKFELNDTVLFGPTNQVGQIRGRAQYAYADNYYLVRYVNGNGNVAEEWFHDDILTKFDV